jgi:hypothetical protein
VEGQFVAALVPYDMSVLFKEVLILVAIFVGLVWFFWTHIASDLPDDFLARSKEHLKCRKAKGEGDGGIRDHW